MLVSTLMKRSSGSPSIAETMTRRLLIVFLTHGVLRSISLAREHSHQNPLCHRSLAMSHTLSVLMAASHGAIAALSSAIMPAESAGAHCAEQRPQQLWSRNIRLVIAPSGQEAE